MARIRSTHPTQWTDEAFVTCSMAARLLAIAIRNDADDNGIFEWKPLQLKMRLFPADNLNIEELLDELVETNQVMSAEIDGRKYGAIRNFTKFQRPKKPNSVHPMNDQFRTYVGLKPRSSPPVPHPNGTTSEKSPQMEDVGGSKEELSDDNSQRNRFEDFWDVFADKRGKDAAKRVWTQRNLEVISMQVIAGARQYVLSRGADRKFWKQAHGWLEDGRWADEQTGRVSSKPLPVDQRQVFIPHGSDEWLEWQAYINPKRLNAMQTNDGYGRFFKTKLPPKDSEAVA